MRTLSFWLAMIVAQAAAFVIFKDLADISQWLVQSSREFTMTVWYNRHLITGIAIADYCLTVQGTPFDCLSDGDISEEFLADEQASENTVTGNTLINNGTNPDADNPFGFAAADFILLSLGSGNCYEDNDYATVFSTFGILPPCP